MANEHIIKISRDFSQFPAGRFRQDGPYTGERFRVEFISPALKEHDVVVVDLSGTLGIGSSFLDEAFGGLVRDEGFSEHELQKRLKIVGGVPSDRELSWARIRAAQEHKHLQN